MKITLDFLNQLNDNSEEYPEDIEFAKENKLIGLEDIDFIEKLIDLNKLNWANCLIVRCIKHKINKINYAVYAIEQIIDIYDKEYPKDNRPQKSIELVKEWIKNPHQKNTNLINKEINNIKNIILKNKELNILEISAWSAILNILHIVLIANETNDLSEDANEIINTVAESEALNAASRVIRNDSNNIAYNEMLKKIISNGIEILKGEK